MSLRTGKHAQTLADRSGLALLIVLALTAVGLALRVVGLDSRGLWLDEAITVRQASQSLPAVIQTLAFGVHPPLYHVIMHFWISAFGRGEIAIRSFSVLVGVAAIPVGYWAGVRLYDRRTALVLAGILALSPFQIWYSQEARMYELLFLAGLVSTTFLVLALRENRPRLWLGYLLSTLVGLFTHYFFLFLLAGQVAFYVFGVLIPAERRARREGTATARLLRPWGLFSDVPTFKPWFASALVTLFLLSVWAVNSVFARAEGGPNALLTSIAGAGLGYGQEGAHFALRFNDTMMVASQMLGGFHPLSSMEMFVAAWPLLLYLTFLLMNLLGPVTWRTWLLVIAAGLGGVVIVLLGQWQGQVLLSRYFMAIAGPATLLAARLLAKIDRRAAAPVMVALALLALVAWADQSYNPRSEMRFDNREAFGAVVPDWRPGDSVLFVPFYMNPLASYYLPDAIPSYGFPRYGQFGHVRDGTGQIDEDLERIVGESPRAWVLLSFQNIPKLRADAYAVRYWFKHNGYRLAVDRRFNQVQLLRFDRKESEKFFLPSSDGTLRPPATNLAGPIPERDRTTQTGRAR